MADPGLRMEVAGSVQTDCRFHKLVWGSFGMSEGSAENGVVCGGGDNGKVYLYNASRLINNSNDALMHRLEEHSGNIAALDINPFQVSFTQVISDYLIAWYLLNEVDSSVTKIEQSHFSFC